MSLKDWQDNGWLKPHRTDSNEIAALMAIVERDLTDASITTLSSDWQFGIAYNAALKLCTIVLYAHGYRPENALAHYRTIAAIKEITTQQWDSYVDYLNACRIRRNTLEYSHVDVISIEEAEKLLAFTKSFLTEVRDYLAKHFPDLL